MTRSFLLLPLLLAACSPGTTQTTVSTGSTVFCETAASAYRVLATAAKAGKLSPAQIANVKQAERLIDPVCQAPTPPADVAAAAQAVATGLQILANIQAGVK